MIAAEHASSIAAQLSIVGALVAGIAGAVWLNRRGPR